MKQKRVDQVLQAVREGLQKAGTPIDEPTLDFSIGIAKDPRFQRLTEQPELLAVASVAAGCLHWAKEYEGMPEGKWTEFLTKMKEELPYLLRPGFRTGMKEMINHFPKRPSTGRSHALNLGQKKRACQLVSQYHFDGDSMRTAYGKVASKMNCSARTVQRAWKQRATLT